MCHSVTDMRKGESLGLNCLSFILLHPRYILEIERGEVYAF